MKEQDARVKADIFPVSSFLISLITFGIITTIQMKILGNYIDVSQIAPVHVILVLILWLLVAATFTILTSYQIRKRYQKPIEDFAEAARKVAAGNFRSTLPPGTVRISWTIWMCCFWISTRWWRNWAALIR